MKFIHFIFIVYLLFFEDVLSQRIISRPELLLENQQQQQQQQQPVSPRGRGRARFSVTPEFEQVQADYEKTARQESPQRTRVATPSKRVITNRRNYEVEEVLDDVPDSARKYLIRPRVVTEMRYEAVNAPRDSTLFIPSSEAAIEPKKDDLLKSSAPSASTIEATNHASSTESTISSSSEDGVKAGDQTTEQEIMSKELMKSSTPEIKTEPLKPQRKRPAPTVDVPAPAKVRTRARKGPPRSGESDSANSSTTSASSIRKEDYLRKQELNRNSKPAVVPETFTKRTEPEPQPQTVQQIVQQSVGRNNFRSGRRRGGSVEFIQPEKESSASTDFKRPRGPSIFQDGQDLQPSRTRTGRRAVNASRRFPSRTTANADETAFTTEQQVNRGRTDGRRGRNFARESQQTQRLEEPTKETSTFSSRRRVPVKSTTSNNPATIRSRTTFDSVKSETTTRINVVQANRTVNRSRSRYNPTNIDEQKLEVLPLFEREPKTVQSSRQQSYNRRRGGKETTSNEFDQKKGRPRVVVVRKETVTESAKPPTFKPTVKESVHSEVSEVISTRKVTRPKLRGTKKATVTAAQKKSSGEEEIDESDNYPEPFKALLHKQHKQSDSKDANNKSSRTRANEDGTSDAADGTTVGSSTAAPVSSSTHLAFTRDALAISSSATPSSEVSPSSASSSLLVDSRTISSSPPALSPDENEILPNIIKPTPIVRPTRRRFSLATKSFQDPTTKKSFVPSRKATASRPYKKYTTDSLSVSVNSSTQRYHARFTGPADALSADNGDVHVHQQPVSSVNLDRPTTFRRNFPTKRSGTTLPVKVVQDRPERKRIPIKGNKIVEQQNNTSAPQKKHGHVAPSAASRYSSRYRGGDLGARLHGAHNAHSRGTTVVPVYVPTIPSITPSTTVSFPSSSGVHTEENDLGLQVISIDEPANSLYSDNLVVMGDNSTTPSSVPKEDNDQKKKSILERIIYSLTALSTTTTTAPPNNDLTNKRLLKKQTANADSNSSAIFKIASKKTKQSNARNQLIKPAQSNDWQMTSLTDNSSERPTTVIERIIDSLSAIQAIDSSTIDPIQVGTSANNIFNAPTKSMSFKRMSTIAPRPIQPPSQPTIIPAHSVGDFISSSPISGDTINMFLKLLNLDTARSTSTTQSKLFDLSTSTPNPIDQFNTSGSNFQSKTFTSSFPSSTFAFSTPQKISTFAPITPQELSTYSPTIRPTIFNFYGTNQPTTASRPPLVDQFTTSPYQSTFNTERIDPTTFKSPSSLFTTNRPTTTISSNNIVTNSITQPPVVTTTHNILNDVELLSTVQPNRSRFQSTTPVPQAQTTIAISLADFLASLNNPPSTMSTNLPMLVPVTSTTLPTVIDTIDSSTAFRDLTSTLAGNLVTETRATTIPTTVTDGQELKNRGLLENFTVSPESVKIVSANDLSQTTFSSDVLSILPLFSDITTTITTTAQEVDTSTQVTTTDINTTTNSITTDSNELTTVSLASTTDLDNNIVTSTDRPAMSQSQNMSQTSRLIADFMRDNAIKPPTSDYYVFAVLPNNTIVRKRPRAFVPQDSPYIIVGVYPNNTVVRKYPNGSLVPEEPVIQDNIIQNVASPSVEAILRSLDSSSSSSSMIQFTTSNPTTIIERNENSIVQLDEILSGKIIEEFNNIMNKTTETSKDAKEVDTLVTTGPNTEELDIDNNVISTRARPEKVIISTTTNPFTITDGVSTNTFSPITSNQPTTTKFFETTTLIPTTSKIITSRPTTTARTTTTTTTDIPTTIFTTTTLNPTTQFRTTRINPLDRFDNGRTTLPPFLANLLSTAIVQETNPPNVPTIFGISRTTSNRPTTTTELYRGSETTVTGPPPSEILEIQTTDWPIFSTSVPRINVVPVIPTRPLVNTPLDVQAILRLLEEYTGSTITPRTVSRTTRRTSTAIYATTDLENEIDSSSRFVELNTHNSRRRFRTTTVSTTIPTTTTTTEVPTTLLTTTTTLTPTTTTVPPTTFISTTQEPTTRRTPSRIKSTEVPTTTQRYFSPTINPSNIDTETLIARAKNRPLTEQQKQDLATLEALENEQKTLLEQLSLLTNLNVKQNKPTNKPPASRNSNSLANRIINFASERDRRTTTEKLPELTLGEKAAVTARNQQPKIAVINGKAIPVDELLKKINDNGINSVSSTYGSSNDAVLAAILKEQGIGPTTPEVLSNIYEDITTTRRTTSRTIRTTTRPAPGPIMQGLSWILNAIGPQNPPINLPPRRFRTNPSTTYRPPTTLQAFEELQTQTALRTTQTTRAPTTTVQFKRPANSLSDEELQRLISQLEAIQKDPRKAKELDLSNLKKLTPAPTTQSQRLRDSVQLVHAGEQGTIPSIDEDSDNVYIRGRKAKLTTAPSVASVSNSISAEDFDVDDDVVVVTKAPARTPAQPPQRPRQTLVPVQLNPIRGIDLGGGGIGQQGDGQVRGSLITAAVNVTRAISTFLGSAIQAAAQQVADMIATPSARGQGLSSSK